MMRSTVGYGSLMFSEQPAADARHDCAQGRTHRDGSWTPSPLKVEVRISKATTLAAAPVRIPAIGETPRLPGLNRPLMNKVRGVNSARFSRRAKAKRQARPAEHGDAPHQRVELWELSRNLARCVGLATGLEGKPLDGNHGRRSVRGLSVAWRGGLDALGVWQEPPAIGCHRQLDCNRAAVDDRVVAERVCGPMLPRGSIVGGLLARDTGRSPSGRVLRANGVSI